jgi:hypothetical protein
MSRQPSLPERSSPRRKPGLSDHRPQQRAECNPSRDPPFETRCPSYPHGPQHPPISLPKSRSKSEVTACLRWRERSNTDTCIHFDTQCGAKVSSVQFYLHPHRQHISTISQYILRAKCVDSRSWYLPWRDSSIPQPGICLDHGAGKIVAVSGPARSAELGVIWSRITVHAGQ